MHLALQEEGGSPADMTMPTICRLHTLPKSIWGAAAKLCKPKPVLFPVWEQGGTIALVLLSPNKMRLWNLVRDTGILCKKKKKSFLSKQKFDEPVLCALVMKELL